MKLKKRCPTCKKRKCLKQFYAHGSTADRLSYECCACQSIRSTRNGRKRKYGLTVAQFIGMLRKQKGKCAICQHKLIIPEVDHDHKTKRVRGLLCPLCNKMLGLARDSKKILQAAIRYLS